MLDRVWPAAMAVAVLCSLATPAFATSRDFQIRSQPLAAALREFSVQSGEPVFFSRREVGAMRSAAVRGRMDAKSALGLLLQDTGFGFEHLRTGFAIVRDRPARRPTRTAVAPRDPAPPVAANIRLLEDIIVTADRQGSFGADLVQAGSFRGARLLDTPLTVGVVTRDVIDAQLGRTIQDAVRNTAGVTNATTNAAVYSNLAIRGIPVENRSNYRLDGALPLVNLIDQPLEDKARVEILKGVASLYYGFSTPAGVVNLTMKRPTAEPIRTIALFGSLGGGNGVHIDVSQPVTDTLGVRVNLVRAGVGYGTDGVVGHRSLAAATVDWHPLPGLTVKLAGERIAKRVTEPSNFQLAMVGDRAVLPPLIDPHRSLASPWMIADNRETNLLGRIEYAVARDWVIAAEAGLSDLRRDRAGSTIRNYDLITGQATQQVRIANDNRHRNDNIRVEASGAFEAAGLVHRVTFGMTRNRRHSEIPVPLLVDLPINIFAPVAVAPIAAPVRVVPNPTRITDSGIYAFDRISWDGKIDVLAGLRGTRYELQSRLGADFVNQSLSPSLAVVVKPWPALSLYATYIEGVEEGGVAPNSAINVGAVLGPAITRQRELGVKVQVRPALMAALSWFAIDRQSAFVNTAGVFVDDGRSLYDGVEASLTGALAPRLQMTISGQWLATRQANAADVTLIGKQVENAPRVAVSAFAEYATPWIAGLSVSAGVFQTGRRAVNNANQAFLPGYAILNLGARLRTNVGGVPMVLALAAENVTGRRYYAATGGGVIGLGLPANVKFSIGATF